MPNDTLAAEVQTALKGATDYFRSRSPDDVSRVYNLRHLQAIEKRLADDIQERTTELPREIERRENGAKDSNWAKLNADQKYQRVNAEQKARQQHFDDLRQVNNGAYPRNISPLVNWLLLILIGIGEWYVNYSTFAARFVPAFAIAGTISVAAIFAVAAHVHGSYLKQRSEILHPSLEYRQSFDRKVWFYLMYFMLLISLGAIVWLRYQSLSDQLGGADNSQSTVFSQSNGPEVWAVLAPTIAINLVIWALGTFVSWALHERVPELRESYRELLRTNRVLDRARAPYQAEEKRLGALYQRERQKNEAAMREYTALLDDVRGMRNRLTG